MAVVLTSLESIEPDTYYTYPVPYLTCCYNFSHFYARAVNYLPLHLIVGSWFQGIVLMIQLVCILRLIFAGQSQSYPGLLV